ncbi:bifunctional RNase H/acid phosphatase [Streptomyces buecherae]|uniref:Bifunctional RNase H/acid phosphatase n=1 Tax=Streptomyces buecherae TaxID=2763006 RepID=A0A7H8N5L9_9ACTN|nr:bifunctional RNase H/acid phosphatase [Streptomyces buecherae]QKW49616.1 bifunctional RNase H/acid phosphatase [Streptomyces buecherae]
MPHRFVVEADGGSRGNPGPAGYGAVVLDEETGRPLAEAAEFIGTATNNVAEYQGLIAGLRAAYALDPAAHVLVRMDSKLVVEQMSGRWKIKHPDMRPLATEAAAIFPAGQVSYAWVPRERNKHADRLANEAMDAGGRGEPWRPASAPTAAGPASPPGTGAGASVVPGPDADLGASATLDATGATEARPAAPTLGWSPAPDLGPPTTFVLLRHGETALTPRKRFSGSTGSDPELSPVGLRQAEHAAAALAARGTIEAVVTSPLRRCRQTARAVADRLGLDVQVDAGLRETDFGAWEGLTFAEVRERYPADLTTWLDSPKAAPTGGGESFAAVAHRVAAARDALIGQYPGRTVLVVTHVTPIKTLVRLALGAPPESLFRMELSAASLSAVAYFGDGNASLRLLNDTSHLR